MAAGFKHDDWEEVISVEGKAKFYRTIVIIDYVLTNLSFIVAYKKELHFFKTPKLNI